MNITLKIFSILIFIFLFFPQNKLEAAEGKCVPLVDYTVQCFQHKTKETCEPLYKECFWDEYVCAPRDICAGSDYNKCNSTALVKSCKWVGLPPTTSNAPKQNVNPVPIEVPKIDNPLGISFVNKFIGNIINSVFGFVGSIALLMFIYGGLLWIMAGGNAEKIKDSRNTLVWAAIGLMFIFLSYAATSILIKVLG